MSYLRYLYLLPYSGVVLCTLCCQFLQVVHLFYCPSVFSNVYLSCVLCTLCCQFVWIVHCFIALGYSLTFICPVSCVPYFASFSGLYICFIALRYSLTFICPVSCIPYVPVSLDCLFLYCSSVFSNVYLLYIIHRFRTNNRLDIKQLKLLTNINNLTFTGADTGVVFLLIEVFFSCFCKTII